MTDLTSAQALRDLNAWLARRGLPTLKSMPRPPFGVSPVEYVLGRALPLVYRIKDPDRDISFRGSEVRFWTSDGYLHVWPLSKSLSDFHDAWAAGLHEPRWGRPRRRTGSPHAARKGAAPAR